MKITANLYRNGIKWAGAIVDKIASYCTRSKVISTEKVNMSFRSLQAIKDSVQLYSVLEDKDYSWRSMDALIAGTKLTKEYIEELIEHENKDSRKIMKISEGERTLYASVTHLIKRALENSKYDWRTLNGVLQETKLEEPLVKNTLAELEERGIVVKTENPKEPQLLYTTLDHYKKTHNLIDFSLSAFNGSIQF